MSHSMAVGEAAIGNNYSLIRVIIHSKSTRHIPYIVGCLVQGPKGAVYMLDNFGYEQLVKSIREKLITVNAGSVGKAVMVSIKEIIEASYRNIIYGDETLLSKSTNEENCVVYAKENGFNFIRRKNVPEFLKKINK